MATLEKRDNEYGKLEIESSSSDQATIFYMPHEEAISAARSNGIILDEFKAKILEISEGQNSITMFPVVTNPRTVRFLKKKYRKISAITLLDSPSSLPRNSSDVREVLGAIPKKFVIDYDYGLGLKYEYRFLIEAIQELCDCTTLKVGDSLETGIDSISPEIFNITYEDLTKMTHDLDLISGRSAGAAKRVKEIRTFNHLAGIIGVEKLPMRTHRIPITTVLSRAAQGYIDIDQEERDLILSSMTDYKEQIARSEPEKLAKLNSDIELVTLKVLIERYTGMLQKKHDENIWQSFFHENPFILSMALGYPIVRIQGQASVGGRKLSGSGVKITDFLLKNNLTNNTALFEIKTPHTRLLNKKPYRSSVFYSHKELAGSVNQALDQKYHFEQEIHTIRGNSRNYELETYAVQCCLIIGKLPKDPDEQKSFELIRGNSKGVQIITFDELHQKLIQLYDLLSSN